MAMDLHYKYSSLFQTYTPMWFAKEGDGDGNGGSGDGDGDGKEGNAGKLAEDLAVSKSQIDSLNTQLKDAQEKLQAADSALLSSDYLEFLDKKEAGGDKGDDKGDKGDKGDDKVDFEEMSKAEIVKFLGDKSAKELKAIKDASEKSIKELTDRVSFSFAQLDIMMARKAHPEYDWDANKKAFFDKAKENPKWDAEHVIRDIQRDLRDEAEKKAKEVKNKEEKDRKALTEKGGSLSPDTTQHKQLSKEEAADIAYRESFGTKE